MTMMKKRKEQNTKKEISLTATLSLPLRTGERAWFYANRHSISTSPVKQILEVSLDGVVFETQNTVYRLAYARLPAESEVMCA